MFAIILAGGAGTRMRPLTYARRKELIPLLNRPLLEYRLLNLAQHGVRDVALACSQGMHEIEDYFGDGASLGLRIQYSYEDRPLGSGRAVKEAARSVGASGTLVVCNGDILTNVDLAAMLAQHEVTGATLSISLAPVDDPWHFGVVEVDSGLGVKHFVEKPLQGEEPSNLINAGTWLWEPAVLDRIPDDDSAVRDGFSERVLFPGIIADRLHVQGFTEDLWVDVGAPDRYFRATQLLLDRRVAEAKSDILGLDGATVGQNVRFAGHVLLGGGVRIDDGARIVGPTTIGDGTTIGAGADVEASIIWADADVGEGARLSGSIIADGVRIGAGARICDAVLASKSAVGEGGSLEPGAKLMPGEAA